MMKMKSAARFTIFSTLLFTAANLIFYLFLAGYLRTRSGTAIEDYMTVMLSGLALLTVGTALIAYFISSLVVDRILNPLRTMISQVKAVGEKRFTTRLVIDSEEDELVEYADAFNEMVMKINEYVGRQKRFVSDASHELATPLTVIGGNADMLLRWGKDDPDLLAESLAVIKNETARMSELVENLLFFARSDENRQQYSFAPTDIGGLIAECVREAGRLHSEHQFSFAPAPLPERAVDAGALRRVFRILLDNAVKHGAKNRHITVSAGSGADGTVLISVADHGPGISPDHLPFIFDRFFRADDSRTKKSGGSGLGLAIAREIVGRHGGRIWAENDDGAIFYLEF